MPDSEEKFKEKRQKVINDDEDKNLLESVKDRLNNIGGSKSDSTPNNSEAEASEAEASEAESSTPHDSAESSEAAIPTEENVEIPDSYVRAAIHQGWDKKDIDEFIKTSPQVAAKTFANIYNSTNNLSNQFAELGRKVQSNEKEEKTDDKSKGKESSFDSLTDEQIEKLKKDYDDDPIVELIIAQNKANKVLYDKVQNLEVNQTVKKSDNEDNKIISNINSFFDSNDMKPFADFYGTSSNGADWDGSLTPGQKANRLEAVRQADAILAGAEFQGRKMELNEALELAHLSVSDPIKEKVIRANIKNAVKQREKGITIKPKSSNKEQDSGKPSNEKELMTRTSERLNKLFG